MTCLQALLKVSLIALFISLLVASVFFIVAGSYVLGVTDVIKHITKFSLIVWPASICVSVGIVFLFITITGFLACFKESQPCLWTFFVLLFVVFIGQILALVFGVIYRNQLATNVEFGLNEEIRLYVENSFYQKEIDFIQTNYQCCGVWNFTDWLRTPYYQQNNASLPSSCSVRAQLYDPANNALISTTRATVPLAENESFALTTTTTSSHDSASLLFHPTTKHTLYFAQGCLEKLQSDFIHNFVTIVVVSSVFGILQVIILLSAVVLVCKMRKSQHYETFTTEYGEEI